MTTDTRPPKLFTPLTIGAAIIVAVFGVTNIVVVPEHAMRWVLGILFLPAAIGLIHLLLRNPNVARRIGRGGGVRAGLVGAGVALATAFAFSFTDAMGWTGEDSVITSGPVWVFLLAGIAIGIDLLGARLEAHAEKDNEGD
jgi:hypothetical protein